MTINTVPLYHGEEGHVPANYLVLRSAEERGTTGTGVRPLSALARSGEPSPCHNPPMGPEFSVVIPTYNRLEVLSEVLQALEFQQEPPSFEVVVVDDGSTDGTGDWLRSRTFRDAAAVLVQDNHGPAAARNTGVAAASGRWVAFLGDDTVPSPGWLAAHREAHRRRGDDPHLGVIGYTGWHRRMRLNPFLRYINEYGLQFGYALIQDKEDVPFNFLYTSNLSLPRDLLLAEPFDLRFPYAAWEDIELGLSFETARVSARSTSPRRRWRTTIRRTSRASPPGRRRRATAPSSSTGSIRSWDPSSGVGPGRAAAAAAGGAAEAPGTPGPGFAKLACSGCPKVWEDVLRYHYIQGLHRAWSEFGAELEKESHP